MNPREKFEKFASELGEYCSNRHILAKTCLHVRVDENSYVQARPYMVMTSESAYWESEKDVVYDVNKGVVGRAFRLGQSIIEDGVFCYEDSDGILKYNQCSHTFFALKVDSDLIVYIRLQGSYGDQRTNSKVLELFNEIFSEETA